MRIIAGTHRGRPLVGPEDDQTTRPITDRVKENLFNRLQSLGVLGYGRVLDLFCGTGSMGLEALSRGAEHCTFVDLDRGATDRLHQNLGALDLGSDRARVVTASALLPAWTHTTPDATLTLALLDPPYPLVRDGLSPFYSLLKTVAPKLEPGGVAVLRTPAEIDTEEVAGYDGPASVAYGKMALHFYQAPMVESEPLERSED